MAKPPCRDGRRNNRPPVSGQFKPGVCPNRAGRPPGGRNKRTIVQDAFNAKVTLNLNGKRIRVTKYESGMIQLASKFALGDIKTFAAGQEALQRYGLMEQETAAFLAPLMARDEPVLEDIIRRIRSSSPISQNFEEKPIDISKPSNGESDSP